MLYINYRVWYFIDLFFKYSDFIWVIAVLKI